LRRPEAGLPGLVADRLEAIVRDVFVVGKILRVRFERQYVFIDKSASAPVSNPRFREKG